MLHNPFFPKLHSIAILSIRLKGLILKGFFTYTVLSLYPHTHQMNPGTHKQLISPPTHNTINASTHGVINVPTYPQSN